MIVCRPGKFFNVQHHQGRIGYGFCQHALGIFPKCPVQFLFRCIRIHYGTFDSHFFHGYHKQVKSPPINGRRHHHVPPGLTDIKHRIIIGRLARRGEHCSHTALQFAYFPGHTFIGRILQPCIKEPTFLQVKKPSHLFRGLILKCSALINGKHPGFPVLRLPSRLDAYCFLSILSAHSLPSAFCANTLFVPTVLFLFCSTAPVLCIPAFYANFCCANCSRRHLTAC